jgi:hypothetical protein
MEGGVRGKYIARFRAEPTWYYSRRMSLSIFPDEQAVNTALRILIRPKGPVRRAQ